MTVIAEKYAKALFSSARAAGELEETRRVFSELSFSLKKGYLDGSVGYPKRFAGFLSLLARRKRAKYLFEIREKFEGLCDADTGTVKAKILTVFPLDETQKSRISAAISRRSGRKIVIDNSIDKDLIGGAVIKMGDRVADYSLASALSALEKAIIS